MSNSDEPPKRTLLGQQSPFDPDAPDAPTHSSQVVIPPGGESTMPMGSTALREALNATLAAGPAAAAAAIAAARAAADPGSTTPMGSAAIHQAASAMEPPAVPNSTRGSIMATARGTPPSQHDLAQAIAKAANAHADRQRSPTGPGSADPSMPRKPTTPGTTPAPGTNPAIGRSPTPGQAAPVAGRTPTPGYASPPTTAPTYGTPAAMNLGAPAVARTQSAGNYGAPDPASLPADSMFARQKPATGPNPTAFAPGVADPARARAVAGSDPTALDMQAPFDPSRGRPPTGPNPAVAQGAYDPSRGRPPTGPNPAVAQEPYDPSRGRPPTGPNPAPYAINPVVASTAPGYAPRPSTDPVTYDPMRGRPPTGPNAELAATAPGYAPEPAKPGSGPHAVDFQAKPGSNPSAAAYDPSRYPVGAVGEPVRPSGYPQPVPAHGATMMASPESQPGQLSPSPQRPRPVSDPTKPVAEREVALDNYDVHGEIARGGMGRILRATDVRLHRQVAIKELVGSSADFKARFERETLITARLQHPAIVPVYDAGRWPTGEMFYTMKLVAGRPLEALIGSIGGMRERLALLPNMIAVAEALAYAHSNNIVHRDLKPANILIGEFGETIVIDWGLAKDLTTNEAVEPAGPFRSAPSSHMGATVAGSVMGTPAYMPLEQGRGLQVDARADVYAIGAVLYHVLGKRAPYEGPDGMSILQELLKAPPPPLAEVAPDVPPELATIVAKAMAREPDQRYPTAAELVADLRRYQNGQMVGVHRYTSRELFRRWAKKHKGALAVAAIAFVALIGVGVVAISRVLAANREAQHEAAVAVEQSQAAQQALARAEQSEARAKRSELTAADERERQRFVRERRVEFDHFAHTQRVSQCAECHPTDPKTFTALVGHPGHQECQGACHEHDAKSMEGVSNDPKCAFCHLDRVATTKDHSSLRACDASSIRAIKAMGGKIGPCFQHDSKAHRIADDGKPLECTTCHAVLADKSKWGPKSYKSLQDLDTNTIIGQGAGGGTDAMHLACTTGCHAHDAETNATSGKSACAKCHPKRSSPTF